MMWQMSCVHGKVRLGPKTGHLGHVQGHVQDMSGTSAAKFGVGTEISEEKKNIHLPLR